MGGGSAGGVGGGSAGGAAGGSGGGSAGAGGGTGGSGGGAAGGAPRGFTWGKLTVPAANAFGAISGLGSGTSVILYAAQHSSRIARFQNGQWTTVYQDPSNTNLVSIWVSPNEEVFAVGSNFADACVSDCAMQSSWTQRSVPTVTFTGVCGSDLQHVYAVGNTNLAKGVLMKFNPSSQGWDMLSNDNGSYSNAGCYVAGDGSVFIAAQSTVVRYDGLSFTPETIDFPPSWTANDKALLLLEAVSGSGTDLYAAGSRKRVLWRDAPGHWVFAFDMASTSDFRALAADSTGAVAAGSNLGGQPTVARGAQQSWGFETNAPDLSVYDAWAASPNEYYLAGSLAGAGTIYRGTR